MIQKKNICIKYALFSGIFNNNVYTIYRKNGSLALLQLLYFCSLVCRDKPQTKFKSSYLSNYCQNINGNGTLFKLNIFMSDLVT